MKAFGGVRLGRTGGVAMLGLTRGAPSPIPAGAEPFLEGKQCQAREDE